MKRILCLLVVLSFYTLYGQDTTQHKWSIGFNFSPDVTYRILNGSYGNDALGLLIKSRDDIEVGKFGYTTGFNISFTHSPRLSFESGIQYSNKGYQTKNIDLVYQTPNTVDPKKVKYKYLYNYIGLPLTAKFIIGRGTFSFGRSSRSFGNPKSHVFVRGGFMTNFLVKAEQIGLFEYPDGNKRTLKQTLTRNFNRIDITPMIGLGIDRPINKKMLFSIESVLRYGIVSTRSSSPLKEHLFSAGINIGISYSLK